MSRRKRNKLPDLNDVLNRVNIFDDSKYLADLLRSMAADCRAAKDYMGVYNLMESADSLDGLWVQVKMMERLLNAKAAEITK